jgi:DNA-binding NtrC family response regulator
MNHTGPSVIIQISPRTQITDIAAQMLRNAGFSIVDADTIDDACERLSASRTELLVLNGRRDEIDSGLDRIATLPSSQRPARIAVLSEDECDDTSLARKVPGVNVHVFVAPLQAFGLLNVVRRIRRQATQTTN